MIFTIFLCVVSFVFGAIMFGDWSETSKGFTTVLPREPKYKLVTDGDKWAIKRRDHKFYDLRSPGFFWAIDDRWFKDCWGDEATARLWFERLSL